MFDKYKEYIVTYDDKFNGGEQYLFKFENNYGASVIRTNGSYGGTLQLWELAVIRWCTDSFDFLWTFSYANPIADDVIGFLSEEDVCKYLEDIKNLKKRVK